MYLQYSFLTNKGDIFMSQRLPINKNNKFCYDIVYEHDFSRLLEEFEQMEFHIHDKKICIITDSNVEKLYLNELINILTPNCVKVISFSFEAGEESKNLDTVQRVYEFLIQNKINRQDFLIALGGGVVGDLTGFCAATYLRGIDFIQIPTTLLAQVDSSIGGKTGVDFSQYKNMVGAFHMPRLVYMNLSVLKDLPGRQYFAGMAEVLKSALIKDGKFYEWLINNFYEICQREADFVEEMIFRTNEIKKSIVEKDPFEKGDRALLNFGHTLGHAIEKYKNFEMLHGECVALGCICAAYISWKRDLITSDDYYEIRDMFVPFCLPITIEDIDPKQIVSLTHSDKKADNHSIKFILLKKVGKGIIDTTVTDEEMLDALNEIHFTEEDMKA